MYRVANARENTLIHRYFWKKNPKLETEQARMMLWAVSCEVIIVFINRDHYLTRLKMKATYRTTLCSLILFALNVVVGAEDCSTTFCFVHDFCNQLNIECGEDGYVCMNTFQCAESVCCPSGYECKKATSAKPTKCQERWSLSSKLKYKQDE